MNYTTIRIAIICFILVAFVSNAQNPSIVSQNYFGGSSDDILTRFESPNGGYYFIGHSYSDISGDKTEASRGFSDVWIIKTDQNYAIEWDKTIGGDYYDDVTDVLILNDTIYILTVSGSSVSGEKTIAPFGTFGWTDLWLLALDLNGNILWQEQYGGNLGESSGLLTQLNNGNILISTLSSSDVSGNKTEGLIGMDDYWLLEISPQNGSIINQKAIGSNLNETLSSTIQTSTNEIILKGGSEQGASGDKTDTGFGAEDIWVVKLDQNYNVLEDKCFGGSNTDSGSDGEIVEHMGYLYMSCASQSGVSGNKTATNHGGNDYWIIKLDLNFNLVWDKSFGGSNDELIGSIGFYPFNKLVVSGASNSAVSGNKTSANYGSYDTWILILDLDGNIVAQESYGGSDIDAGVVQPELDGTKILLTNYSTSGVSGNKSVPSHGGYDCWFLELDASSFLSIEEFGETSLAVLAYPNPATDYINFRFEDLHNRAVIRLFTIDGKELLTKEVDQGITNVSIDLPYTNQILLYEVTSGAFKKNGKVVVH